MNSGIYIGVDFGLKRIGLARSDPTGLIASAYKTITYKSINRAIDEIVEDMEVDKDKWYAVEWDGDGTEPEWTAGTDTAYFYTTDGGVTVKGMMVRAGA